MREYSDPILHHDQGISVTDLPKLHTKIIEIMLPKRIHKAEFEVRSKWSNS